MIPYNYDPRMVGFNIKMRREQLGLSQQSVATTVGTSQSAVSNVENGTRSLTLRSASKYAKALNMRIVINPDGVWMEGEKSW